MAVFKSQISNRKITKDLSELKNIWSVNLGAGPTLKYAFPEEKQEGEKMHGNAAVTTELDALNASQGHGP